MLDLEDLRALTVEERRQLRRMLADLDDLHPLDDPRVIRRRRLGLVFFSSACVFLIFWIGYLAATLPRTYEATHWKASWAGFDVFLLAGLAATAWASWRKRQVFMIFAVATAALLVCDAWFDITTSWGTRDLPMSIASAACVELPVSALLLVGVRRIARLSLEVTRIRTGAEGPLPSLRRIPLFTVD